MSAGYGSKSFLNYKSYDLLIEKLSADHDAKFTTYRQHLEYLRNKEVENKVSIGEDIIIGVYKTVMPGGAQCEEYCKWSWYFAHRIILDVELKRHIDIKRYPTNSHNRAYWEPVQTYSRNHVEALLLER